MIEFKNKWNFQTLADRNSLNLNHCCSNNSRAMMEDSEHCIIYINHQSLKPLVLGHVWSHGHGFAAPHPHHPPEPVVRQATAWSSSASRWRRWRRSSSAWAATTPRPTWRRTSACSRPGGGCPGRIRRPWERIPHTDLNIGEVLKPYLYVYLMDVFFFNCGPFMDSHHFLSMKLIVKILGQYVWWLYGRFKKQRMVWLVV